MKIMFMGTPEIAATVLRKLLDDGHNVTSVITREDKPRGRGNVMTPTPVKALAVERGIPVFTPKTLRDEAFSALLAEQNPALILVVAFGKILPENVLAYPKYGCVNLHVSLLPKYRGAAPMQRAIMAEEKETGVTVMYMDAGLDTGDIITVAKFPIGPEDDFEAVHDRSAEIGAKLLSEVVTDMENGREIPRQKQNEEGACYAPKVEKEEGKIDFEKPAPVLDPIIRGVTPIPGAYAFLNGKTVKFCRAKPCGVTDAEAKEAPGKVLSLDAQGQGAIRIRCAEGALTLTELVPEGKGRMSAGDFIRGRKISLGDFFS